MPRRNSPASGGRGHMKGPSEFGRGRSFPGMHPMRQANLFIAPRISPEMGSTALRNLGSEHTRDMNRRDRDSMVAVVDESTCRGCGACVDACPEDAITMDTVARIDTRRCQGCAVCINSCPFGTITMDYA